MPTGSRVRPLARLFARLSLLGSSAVALLGGHRLPNPFVFTASHHKPEPFSNLCASAASSTRASGGQACRRRSTISKRSKLALSRRNASRRIRLIALRSTARFAQRLPMTKPRRACSEVPGATLTASQAPWRRRPELITRVKSAALLRLDLRPPMAGAPRPDRLGV